MAYTWNPSIWEAREQDYRVRSCRQIKKVNFYHWASCCLHFSKPCWFPFLSVAQHFKLFVSYISPSDLLAMPLPCSLGILIFFDASIFYKCNTKEMAPSFAPVFGTILFVQDKSELFLGLVHLPLYRAPTRVISQSRASYALHDFPYYRSSILDILSSTLKITAYFTRLFWEKWDTERKQWRNDGQMGESLGKTTHKMRIREWRWNWSASRMPPCFI